MSDSADPREVPQHMVNPEVESATEATESGANAPAHPGHDGTHRDAFEDFEAIAAASADMITVATAEGVYRYVSPASQRLFGWDPVELQGRNQEEFAHPDDVESLRGAATLTVPADGESTTTYRFRRADGPYRWVEGTFRSFEAQGGSFVTAVIRDIAERQKSAVLLQRQASTDPLTGLANRAVMMDRLRQALRRRDRSRGILAVLFLDLDRFKVINDSLGHRLGDRVLQAMAERLTHFLRASDTLARLGGDEFVIVAEDVADETAAAELGNRITEAGRERFRVDGEEFVCTVSVGIATTADPRYSAETLLQEADLALYRAKDRGRDRAEVFDEDLRTTVVGRLVTERMLRRAIDEERLRVHYQPIIDLRSGRVASVEALIRVFDLELGILEAASFLEVAEETGLLYVMDEWVLTDVMCQAVDWRARLGETDCPGLGINVTPRRVADAAFPQAIIVALDSSGLSRDSFQVEVTEQVLMEASNSAMAGLRSLREAGIRVGLDDFGTGFSSLAYLRQFPLDFVKIDGLFIHELDRDAGERAIVAAIVDLSHALGLEVVAEGVQTRGQLESLIALGCDRAQGFLFAPPGEPGEVDELVIAGGYHLG